MKTFPVTNSNLSAYHLGIFLQEQYSFSSHTTCELIRAGLNDTYKIKDQNQQYVFRVYSFQWRTLIEINEEIKLLLNLAAHNLSISYPIADTHQQYIQTLPAPEGERFGVLFSYAAGEKMHNLSNDTHFQVGKLMAQFHQITENQSLERTTYTPTVLLIDSLQKIARFLQADTAEMDFMRKIQELLLQIFETNPFTNVRKGIVHLDIWFDNLNVTKDNQITIFDFDFCGNGWLCLDLAYYIMQLHNIEKYDAAAYQPKIDSFMAGYESIQSISQEEKRLIPMLGICIYYFYLGVQSQRYENWSNSFLSEDYLKRFINGLIKRYYDINKHNSKQA